MASEKDITERIPGLTRRKDGLLQGAPTLFTLIGPDIGAEVLKRKYKGTPHEERARALIEAAEQERRTSKPPSPAFVETCRGGVVSPIAIADLREDKDGKTWALIMDGRSRRVAVDILNGEPGAVPKDLIAFVKTFKKDSPKQHALEVRSVANCHNPRTHSQRAEDAAALVLENTARPYIVTLTECRDEKELEALLALHECVTEVKDAVDAGKLLLSKAPWYAKQSPEVQRDAAARAMAGGSRRAQNEAAPARAKTRPAPVLAAWEAEARRITEGADPSEDRALMLSCYADGLAAAQGKTPPEYAADIHASADAMRKAGKAKKEGGK